VEHRRQHGIAGKTALPRKQHCRENTMDAHPAKSGFRPNSAPYILGVATKSQVKFHA
jgi:hypothetical protein